MKYEKELNFCLDLVKSVREKILEIYNSDDFDTEIKSDNSPVTKADKYVDKVIGEALRKEFPEYGLLTEESNDDLSRLEKKKIFIVDPIDGTKDFVGKTGQFSVNIGLAVNHKAVMGVIGIPVTGEIFYAVEDEGSFYLKNADAKPEKIHVSDRNNNLIAFISHFHVQEADQKYYEKHKDKFYEFVSVGSSYKGCLIAKGEGDYVHQTSQNTKEWDTCAMQVIVEQAGGFLLDVLGNPITYNRADVYNRNGYMICNKIENFFK